MKARQILKVMILNLMANTTCLSKSQICYNVYFVVFVRAQMSIRFHKLILTLMSLRKKVISSKNLIV